MPVDGVELAGADLGGHRVVFAHVAHLGEWGAGAAALSVVGTRAGLKWISEAPS